MLSPLSPELPSINAITRRHSSCLFSSPGVWFIHYYPALHHSRYSILLYYQLLLTSPFKIQHFTWHHATPQPTNHCHGHCTSPQTNYQPRTNRYTRAGMVRVVLVALFTTFLVLSVVALSSTPPLPLWKQYPFVLVPSDPEHFTFPEAEGGHNSSESDSWFITAHLTGLKTGKSSISSSLPAFFTKDDHRHTVSFCQHLW